MGCRVPPACGTVNEMTRTPGRGNRGYDCIGIAAGADFAADVTSRLTLIVFAVVNVSLGFIKRRGPTRPVGIYVAPTWVPCAGAAACVLLLAVDVRSGLLGNGSPVLSGRSAPSLFFATPPCCAKVTDPEGWADLTPIVSARTSSDFRFPRRCLRYLPECRAPRTPW